MSWFDGLLYPIMVAVAWIMVQFHSLLTWLGLDPAGGAAWGFSIVGLVIVMRIILIPLFFKQIKASRGMQMLAPDMKKIQAKYKGKTDPASREAMSRETMELYRKHGTNPFSSCLPILAQSPIFFALFRVLNSLPQLASGDYPRPNLGPLTQDLAAQAESATILGAPLSATFMNAAQFGDAAANVRVVTIILVVAMSLTTFTTQRQLTMKNMPPAALEGPMAQQQKMLMYVFPLIFAFSGVNFPIGVLIYWTTTNLWSMGQQFYTIRRMPAPGSQAEAALKARQAKKASHKGLSIEESDTLTIEEKPVSGQRQQPVGKARAKKQRPAGAPGAATGAATGTSAAGAAGAAKTGSVGATKAGSGTTPAAGVKGGSPKASGTGASGSGSAQGGKPAGGAGSGQPSSGKKKRSGSGQGAGGSAQSRPGSTPSGSATDD
ncbi:membrane protein insertase YidC [Cellulomonas sp. IC4_254]|uniref:membrane protein insertase YidC n=1 Tax=Cellulomonas sp. IC4_254 TaxID=2714040 RepID=UPI001422973D|nr:membrane protein insertase YidC [Cellulomonas sp. IC4_254]NHT16425.1 membrane protein insertase YidC [Cellulomonas sp. IC4_254]